MSTPTGRFLDPMTCRDMIADLATTSRDIPVDWVILRAGVRIGGVACPDENTAAILATFRYGVDVTVRRQGEQP